MRKIKETIYNFDELEKDIQEKLIEKEKEMIYDDYLEFSLESDMDIISNELLDNCFGKKVTFNKVYYDLSYSQGSGCMIAFSIDFEELNKKYHIVSDEEMRLINDKELVSTINIVHSDVRYNHEYSFNIEYDTYFNSYCYEDIKNEYNITELEFDKLKTKIDCLFYVDINKPNKLIQDIIDMNKEVTKIGYDLIEHCDDDIDYIVEKLKENEYYIDGTVYCE